MGKKCALAVVADGARIKQLETNISIKRARGLFIGIDTSAEKRRQKKYTHGCRQK
jgi:hypothetical protein